MSDSESDTVRVPNDNPLFRGEGPSATQNPDCSSVPIFICPRCKFANVLTASLNICFACACFEAMENKDDNNSDA